MKIVNVTRTSRSHSLPVTPQMRPLVSDEVAVSDHIDHLIRATTFMHHTIHPGGAEGTNHVQASGRYLAPVQDESYMTIQEVQGNSDEEPLDIFETRVSPNYATPAVAHRGRLLAKFPKSRRLVQNVTRTSRSHSLPVTPQMRPLVSDEVAVSDHIDHLIRATSVMHNTSHPESYMTIQAVEPSLVAAEAQGTSDEEPPDIVVTRASTNYAAPAVAHRGRLFGKCQKGRRLVQKNGRSNVETKRVEKKRRRYIRDLFTTIMDLRWHYHVLMFISGFIVSWLFFAVLWLTLAHFNGDVDRSDDDPDLCVDHVYDFSTALLYSLETQTTIGYGYRVIGAHCPIGTTILMAQTCFGIFIQCFTTGIVFAKIARPKRRAQTIVFSNEAVICMRDGFYNLIFRVGDLRKTHIIGTSIRALLVKSRLTNEGELIPLCQFPLELATESSVADNIIFFFWPVTVAHQITPSSPLWNISAETILSEHFEIIVILEGTVQTSGALIQIRTSYVPSEIKWGQRLTPLVTHLRDDDESEIDFSNFHSTTPVFMPDCSAKEYTERMATNGLDSPVEAGYRHNFTCPPVMSKDRRYFPRWNGVTNRLQTLFQRKRIGARPKSTRRNDSGKDEQKRVEAEEMGGSSPSETDLASLSPPPTYASCAGAHGNENLGDVEMDFLEVPAPKVRAPKVRAKASVHYESEGLTSLDVNPVRSRIGGQVNIAFQSSVA